MFGNSAGDRRGGGAYQSRRCLTRLQKTCGRTCGGGWLSRIPVSWYPALLLCAIGLCVVAGIWLLLRFTRLGAGRFGAGDSDDDSGEPAVAIIPRSTHAAAAAREWSAIAEQHFAQSATVAPPLATASQTGERDRDRSRVVVLGDTTPLTFDRSEHVRLIHLIQSFLDSSGGGWDVDFVPRHNQPEPLLAGMTATAAAAASGDSERRRLSVVPRPNDFVATTANARALIVLHAAQPNRAFADALAEQRSGSTTAEWDATAFVDAFRTAKREVVYLLAGSIVDVPNGYRGTKAGSLPARGYEVRAMNWARELSRATLFITETARQRVELETIFPNVPCVVVPLTPYRAIAVAGAAAAQPPSPLLFRDGTDGPGLRLVFVEESTDDAFAVNWFFQRIFPQIERRLAPYPPTAAGPITLHLLFVTARAATNDAGTSEFIRTVQFFEHSLRRGDGRAGTLKVVVDIVTPPHRSGAASLVSAFVSPLEHALDGAATARGIRTVLLSLALPHRVTKLAAGVHAPVRLSLAVALSIGVPVITNRDTEASAGMSLPADAPVIRSDSPLAIADAVHQFWQSAIDATVALVRQKPLSASEDVWLDVSAQSRAAAAQLFQSIARWDRAFGLVRSHIDRIAPPPPPASAAPVAVAATAHRLRVLMVHISIPLGDQKGCDARLLQVIRALLDAGHHVTYVGFDTDPQQTAEHRKQLDAIDAGRRQLVVIERYDRGGDSTLKYWACEGSFHAAILFFWTTTPYWLFLDELITGLRTHAPATRIAVLADDITFERQRSAALASSTLESLNFETGFSQRLQEVELSFFRRADRVLTISTADRLIVEAALHALHAPAANAMPSFGVLRLVSDRALAAASAGQSLVAATAHTPFARRSGVVFVGASNGINAASLSWFIQHIYPLIQHAAGEHVPLTVIGSIRVSSLTAAAQREVTRLASIDTPIAFTGFVASAAALTAALASARVFVSPIVAGTGINTKNVLALEHGLPLVTTSTGARALAIERCNGCARVADSAHEFSAAVLSLYQNEKLWNSASLAALQHIEAEFGPAGLAADVRDLAEWVLPATIAMVDRDAELRFECRRRNQLAAYSGQY